MDKCEFSFLTDAICTDGEKTFKLAWCTDFGSDCSYPARYCAVKHQEEHMQDRMGLKQRM